MNILNLLRDGHVLNNTVVDDIFLHVLFAQLGIFIITEAKERFGMSLERCIGSVIFRQ